MTARRWLGALAALLVGTTSAAPAAPSRHPWTQPGHLRIGVLRTIDNLNPLLTNQSAVSDLAQFLFSGLVRTDDRGEMRARRGDRGADAAQRRHLARRHDDRLSPAPERALRRRRPAHGARRRLHVPADHEPAQQRRAALSVRSGAERRRQGRPHHRRAAQGSVRAVHRRLLPLRRARRDSARAPARRQAGPQPRRVQHPSGRQRPVHGAELRGELAARDGAQPVLVRRQAGSAADHVSHHPEREHADGLAADARDRLLFRRPGAAVPATAHVRRRDGEREGLQSVRAARVRRRPRAVRRRARPPRRRAGDRFRRDRADRLPRRRSAGLGRRLPAVVGLHAAARSERVRPRVGARAARRGGLEAGARRDPRPQRRAARAGDGRPSAA